MLGFWETEMRHRMMRLYSFAPFLEEAGTLLLAAKHTWHPWSVKRLEELGRIAYTLKDRAKTFRQRGLAWASNISEFGEDPAYLLSTSAFHRYHKETAKPHPDITPHLVSTAAQLLFLILPAFKKIEETSWEDRGLVPWLSEILEILMESPYIGTFPSTPIDLLAHIGTDAVFLECEGLAYTQARLEDGYARKNIHTQRKKKSDLSRETLEALAADIDVPFEVIKEAFETEYSTWWEQATEYSKQAKAQRELFLFSLRLQPSEKDALRTVWTPGTPSQDIDGYITESAITKSENIIKTFISLFLSFQGRKKKEDQAIPQLFLETQ